MSRPEHVTRKTTPENRGFFPTPWIVVAVSTLVMIGFYGTAVTFSVFLKPLIGEFGWTRAGISGGMSILAGTAGLAGILMGALVDRYGARVLITTGAFVGGVGYLLMSGMDSLWQLYVYFGVMMGICQASCWVPITAVISRSFAEKRVLALGISTSGITIGHMVMPPLIAYFMVIHGWRLSYLLLAAIVWTTAIPALLLLGGAPAEGNQVPPAETTPGNRGDGEEASLERKRIVLEAARTLTFWMILTTGFVIAIAYYFVIAHIVAYATDRGITATAAATVFTSVGGGSILGKLLVWSIFTRVGSRITLMLLLALQAMALLLFMHATSLWMFYILGALFGFGFGATAPIRTSMIPEFFGTKAVGTIIGLSNAAYSVGGLGGPVMAGYLFDLNRNYNMAFIAGALLLTLGIVAAYFLAAPERHAP